MRSVDFDCVSDNPYKNNVDMKANEAPKSKFVYPDKLYARTNDNITLDISYAPQTLDAVEYVRTDAFIEKALKWYCLDCICNDTCSNTCYFKSTFKKYLEGDDKQLPPKIENAINPDGSTTENYRYRHFISRMQDAFIEKAKSWFIQQHTGMWNEFKNYMKGE